MQAPVYYAEGGLKVNKQSHVVNSVTISLVSLQVPWYWEYATASGLCFPGHGLVIFPHAQEHKLLI